MQTLENQFSFPQDLLNDAVVVPDGHFVEVDDLLYEVNLLGKKIVQAQTVMVGTQKVSVGAIGGDSHGYELIVSSENPKDLGGYDQIISDNKDLFLALQKSFGDHFIPLEMVIAIREAQKAGAASTKLDVLAKIAVEAKAHVKRAFWVANNHVAAFSKAPMDWASVGL